MTKQERIEKLLNRMAEGNNVIDLNAYASGLGDMYDELANSSNDIQNVGALFTIPEMKQAYEHAQWSIIDHGHGETSEEYMKRKHNVR